MTGRPLGMLMRFGLFGLLIAIALISLVWLPYDPIAVDLDHMLATPSWTHWFGTDEFGRDVAARAMLGARISVFLAIETVIVTIVAGTVLGVIAGFVGGWIERLIMTIADAVLAFPAMLLALGLVAVLGGSANAIVTALAIAYLPATVRIVRARVLSVRASEFVEASRAAGDGAVYTMCRHVLPNALPPIIVLATSLFGWVILYESALSFLGVGVAPPTPTWGNMLSAARPYIHDAAWLSIIPGLCIVAALFGVNVAGDALHDYLDPRHAG